MESTTKKIILPTKGICNATPPQICDDSELLDCQGLTFLNDALRPIQTPPTDGSVTGKLLYVHNLPDGSGKNKISYDSSSDLRCNNTVFANLSGVTAVNAIGNTLIVNTSNGIYFYLWKGSYESLGNKLPDLDVRFALNGAYDINEDKELYIAGNTSNAKKSNQWTEHCKQFSTNVKHVYSFNYWAEEWINWDWTTKALDKDTVQYTKTFTDLSYGLYSENKKKIAKRKGFCCPFFVRAAYELHDGSYVMPSAPILMLPAISENSFAINSSLGGTIMCMFTIYSKLLYKQNTQNLEKYSDIIKNITLFISDDIELYDTDADASTENTSANPQKILDGIFRINGNNVYQSGKSAAAQSTPDYASITGGIQFSFKVDVDTTQGENVGPYRVLVKDNEENIKRQITSTSVFYKLCEIGTSITSSYIDASDKIEKNTLLNITTQPTLVNSINGDDYYSHCTYKADAAYTFNRRLNLIGVTRQFYSGFNQFMPYEGSTSSNGTVVKVKIETPSGTKYAYKTLSTSDIFSTHMWFYYPDPRAKEVTIGSKTIYLTEHSGLNGAYYFGGLPNGTETALTGIQLGTNSSEYLPNYLLQSEVDNPFTFQASGYVRVGQGNIIGLSALTTALSQDAYKVATTLVFTTQGIWALKINDEGQYASVPPPFSREVALSTADITMIDNGVFFVSEKGLMLITDDGIKCVSSHLSGRNPSDAEKDLGCNYANFKAFLRNCNMAYDYKNSLLWLTNNQVQGSTSAFPYHWIYNIATGTFSRLVNDITYSAVVPDYPDTLLQSDNGALYSLLKTPDINDESDDYSCFFITRPHKFSESIHLKTIRELHHIYESVSGDLQISIDIYASNDTYSWHKIDSLHGRGFKYFILKVIFEGMKAIDSYSGTIIGYDTKQTDKIR